MYDIAELKKTVNNLIMLKTEIGGYWDFKAKWYENDGAGKGDMLHDIICMANNLENRDAYIMGVLKIKNQE